jgi:hypothetical protein
LDLIGTAIINVAFTIGYASTIQMLRNTMLICTSLFSIVLIRRPLRSHEVIGILIMTVGMVVGGIYAIRNPDETSSVSDDKAWLGIVLTLIGTVFNAFQIILEEWYFKTHYMEPMLCMGLQGAFGLGFNAIAILIFHYSGVSNMAHGFYQMGQDTTILIGNIWYLIVVCFFNAGSICVTKLGSGLLRAVIYSLRAPIVWVVELIVGWQIFSVEQLMALILSAIGFFFYAFIMPGIRLDNWPKTYRFFRYQVPCFCTRHDPQTELEDFDDIRYDDVARHDKTNQPTKTSQPDV